MPVPRRRKCKARRDRGRTHKKLGAPSLIPCDNCGEPKASHRICPNYGQYKGHPYKAVVTA